VYGSMQCPYYVQRALERMLACDRDKVHVIAMTTGGGFGGKEEYPSILAAHAAILAHKTGLPVKMVYDREEDLKATTKRHPGMIRHRTGVSADGRLCAMEVEILLDGGAYCTLSPVVLSRAAIHAAGPYRCEHVRITGRVVATNNPPYGAFRGFGVPQACFAVERQMDRVAAALAISPLEIRRRNVLRLGDYTATGQRLTSSVAASEVLEEAVRRSGYQSKWASQRASGTVRRGIGLSLFFHGAGFTGSGEDKIRGRAGLEALAGGRVRVLSAATEIGQGTQTVFTQIVAEELGIDPALVEIAPADTARVPDSGPTVASRTCMIVGGVLQEAARALRAELETFCRETKAESSDWPTRVDRYLAERGPLAAFKQHQRPAGLEWDESNYRGDAYSAYSWAADVVEADVDLDTYETKLTRLTTCHEIGKVINPQMTEGQIEGGTLQALGYALYEEVRMSEGEMANARLTNYIIPTTMDVPIMETHLIETEFAHGPHGAKGVGELPMDGGAPAVAAAIEDATGFFLAELPMLPERLFEKATNTEPRA
ncbi:MAG: xanthine dehydrogenase family protein molybdopterin-binding subunit, partial [Acidobacteriota bacterium]